MKNIFVIDYSDQIKSALYDAEAQLTYTDDDVRALNISEAKQPSVILLHYKIRTTETADYIQLIHNVSPDSIIILIADELDEDTILDCLIAGAKGYQDISQLNVYSQRLLNAIDAGEAWITRRMVANLLDRLRLTENNEIT